MRPYRVPQRSLPAVILLPLLALGLLGCSYTGPGSDHTDPATPSVGQAAPDFELRTVDGMRHRLSTYTDGGPVVLMVLRGYPGYQCPICSAQVGAYISEAQAFAQRDATVIFVYPGPAEGLTEHASDFIAGQGLPSNFLFLVDPDYTFTNRYGVRWDEEGQTAYPSTFVIDQGSRTVRHAHISHGVRNRTAPQDILRVLDAEQEQDRPQRQRNSRPGRY